MKLLWTVDEVSARNVEEAEKREYEKFSQDSHKSSLTRATVKQK